MELTGKAKEQFEKWYNSNVAVENEEVKSFLRLPEAMQWGVYQDFADGLSMPIETYVGDTYYYDYLIDFNPSKEGAFKTRQEARNAAIKKLNELINKQIR